MTTSSGARPWGASGTRLQAVAARGRVPRAARAVFVTIDGAVRWATPPPHVQPAEWATRSAWCGAWRRPTAPWIPYGDPPPEGLPYRHPRRSPLSIARRERPAAGGRPPLALSHGAARPHRRHRVGVARGHREADQCTGGTGARRRRSWRWPAHPSPHHVWHVALSAPASHHPVGSVWRCTPARPCLSDPEPPQRFSSPRRDTCDPLDGPGHVRPHAPARSACGPHRPPPATPARLAAPLRRADAGALVSGERRCRTPPARAVDLPRAGQGQRYLLGSACHPGVARLGHTTSGAGAQGADVMTTTIACPRVWEPCCTARVGRQPQASPHTMASDRDTCCRLVRLAQPRGTQRLQPGRWPLWRHR